MHLLRNEGVMTAAKETARYSQRSIENAVASFPGHYRFRRVLLSRQYDSEEITPQWVSPSEISYLTGGYETLDRGHLDYAPYFKPEHAGSKLMSYKQEVPYRASVPGDWDQHREPFSRLLIYRGIRQRFVEEIPWPETVYYERLAARFCNQGLETKRANTLAMERCEHIESVYQSIKSDGYQSQRELNGHPLHEITVNIARDGTLLYNSEGRHRLSIAKILDVEKVPVLVLAEHIDCGG